MSAYCETSFFRRLMIPGVSHAEAAAAAAEVQGELGHVPVSSLTRFEFVQGLRFDFWLHQHHKSKGVPAAVGENVLNLFLAEIGGDFRLVLPDYEQVLREAESLSRQTPEKGYRSMDLLHVAAAKVLGVDKFFSFDRTQNELAEASGLKTPLKKLAC